MDFSDIQLELGVGTCCGCCETCARELVAACGQADAAPRKVEMHGTLHAAA